MDEHDSDRRGSPLLVVLMVIGALVSLGAVAFAVVLLARPAGGMQVEGAAVGATVSDSAALYMTLRNDSDQPDELIRVDCACAASTVLHRGGIGADGTVDMSDAARVDILAGAAVEFGPGGDHVMLEGLTEPLVEGESVELDLVFSSGPQRVEVPVVSLASLAERAAAQLGSADVSDSLDGP